MLLYSYVTYLNNLWCLGFIKYLAGLPGVKQLNRRDIQEEILSFISVVFLVKSSP